MIVPLELSVHRRHFVHCQVVSHHRKKGDHHIDLSRRVEVGCMSLREVAVKRVGVEDYGSRT